MAKVIRKARCKSDWHNKVHQHGLSGFHVNSFGVSWSRRQFNSSRLFPWLCTFEAAGEPAVGPADTATECNAGSPSARLTSPTNEIPVR